MPSLDAHARPPEALRQRFKSYQKLTLEELHTAPDIVDLQAGIVSDQIFRCFPFDLSSSLDLQDLPPGLPPLHGLVCEALRIPGLFILPKLFSIPTQSWLLDRLLHRDLADQRHLTNLHKHYHVTYDQCEPPPQSLVNESTPQSGCLSRSFFHISPNFDKAFTPLDPNVHKSLTVRRALDRKLRWVTIGGQYDWTAKMYPDTEPPSFPEDIANMIRFAFPAIKPEAAIVNVYSPGDTLSLHRDVSEESSQGLVSISIGCDALFIVGIEKETDICEHLVLRLRSGDALLMSGEARYAWHGVPRIFLDTCPEGIKSWPAESGSDSEQASTCETHDQFGAWRGWLAGKRINLNVRQMRDY